VLAIMTAALKKAIEAWQNRDPMLRACTYTAIDVGMLANTNEWDVEERATIRVALRLLAQAAVAVKPKRRRKG